MTRRGGGGGGGVVFFFFGSVWEKRETQLFSHKEPVGHTLTTLQGSTEKSLEDKLLTQGSSP